MSALAVMLVASPSWAAEPFAPPPPVATPAGAPNGAARPSPQPGSAASRATESAQVAGSGSPAPGAGAAHTVQPADTLLASAAVEFNGSMLMGGATNSVDLSRYARGNPMVAGTYRADSYLNSQWLGRLDVELARNPASGEIEVCVDRALVRRLGLDTAKVPPRVQDFLLKSTAPPDAGLAGRCLWVREIDPSAAARFDTGELRLDLSVPQLLISKRPRGYVPPEAWDDGVRALAVDYQLSNFHVAGSNGQRSTNSNYVGLTARANLGAGWQFTHTGNYQSTGSAPSRYTKLANYVSHDIPSLASSLTIGNLNSGGQVFDSIAFRGVRLASDERMVPDSQRGFAPVIRGQARGNAVVSVRQNGMLISEVVVPPGPFEINDLYPPGVGGDLVVTVKEADGSEQTSIVPFTAGPQVLREGQLRHEIALGDVGSAFGYGQSNFQRHRFALGTVQYGFNNTATGSLGLAGMARYAQVLLGGAFNTSVGALGASVASSRFESAYGGTLHGASYNANYALVVPRWRSNFTFAAYRYNTADFVSLNDAAQAVDGQLRPQNTRIKRRLVATAYQALSDSSTVYLSANSQSYWDGRPEYRYYNLGLNQRIRSAQLSLSVGRSAYSNGSGTTVYAVGLTLPLEFGTPGSGGTRTSLSTNYQHDSRFGGTAQAFASGVVGEDNRISYGVSAIKPQTGSDTLGVNVGWQSGVGNVSASVSRSNGNWQSSLSMQGGFVLHGGGLTLAPSVGDTYALVEAPDAVGATVVRGAYLSIGRSGYAVVPYLSPYRINDIDLDLRDVSLDTELETTSAQVTPRAGAAVAVKFKGRSGTAALVDLTGPNGPLPLGASIVDAEGQTVGLVSQGSLAEIRVKAPKGRLVVQWGEGEAKRCSFSYDLPEKKPGQAFVRATGSCL